MSLSGHDIHRLAAANTPVLCLDTCALLDIVRDVTRETTRPSDVAVALTLLATIESAAAAVVLLADQVRTELIANLSNVEQESEQLLKKFRSRAGNIDALAALYGARGTADTKHWDGHWVRARAVFQRWLGLAITVPVNKETAARALVRVNAPRTPARHGKESMKDCVIVEAYLEAAAMLRAAGSRAPIVFASSNVKEFYMTGTSTLQPDIAADFSTVNVDYAPNMGAAKHLLGV